MGARHETADDYSSVVAASGRWRLIRSRDDVQFILQRRREGAPSGGRPWRAVAYVLDPKALGAELERRGAPDLVSLMPRRL